MSSDAMHEAAVETPQVTSTPVSPTRPYYWSVRRELWEHRWLYLAPLAVSIFIVVGFLLSTIGMPHRRRAVSLLDEGHQRAAIGEPYNFSSGMLLLTVFVVGAFYCLDALYGERRDRSILFWKSLPVSDRTTVLAKATIPYAVLPAVAFVITMVIHLIMVTWSTMLLLGAGIPASTLFSQLQYIPSPFVILYAVAAIALWHAPIYAWLLLVSAWAKRAAILWAVLPVIVPMMLEAMIFRTAHFAKFIGWRFYGCIDQAFVTPAKRVPHVQPPTVLAPINFLLTPGLWLGLVIAAALLAAAIRLRRNREPI
jgi:ABC-2 type transport system permease protein